MCEQEKHPTAIVMRSGFREMVNRSIVFLFIAIALSGCTASNMRSYIGQDVRTLVVNYGAPDNEVDLADGRRAFQWERERIVTDDSFSALARLHRYSDSVDFGDWLAPREIQTQKCIYTLICQWDEQMASWIIEEAQKPFPNCW